MTLRSTLSLSALLALALTLPAAPVLADKSQPMAERKASYAPWDPAQMPQRRKDYGLIGPGAQNPVPPPAFPS